MNAGGDLKDGALVSGCLYGRLGLLLLLESAEVVLDEERGVELAHRHIVFD